MAHLHASYSPGLRTYFGTLKFLSYDLRTVWTVTAAIRQAIDLFLFFFQDANPSTYWQLCCQDRRVKMNGFSTQRRQTKTNPIFISNSKEDTRILDILNFLP